MDAELEFRVMGTTAHVLVVAASADAARVGAERARDRLDELEARWSRFLPTSEVSVLNGSGGAPVVVSAETRTLVERAVEGSQRTGGRFDPTVLDSLVALGYDRDYDAIDRDSPAPATTITPPRWGGVVVDRVGGGGGGAGGGGVPPRRRRSPRPGARGSSSIASSARFACRAACTSTRAASARAWPPTWWSRSSCAAVSTARV